MPDPDSGLRKRKGGHKKQDKKGDSKSPTQEGSTAQPPAQQNPPVTPGVQYQEVVYVPPNRIVLAIPKWMFIVVTIVMGVLFVGFGGYMGDVLWKKYFMVNRGLGDSAIVAVKASIGEEATDLFITFDRDSDGKLSLEEYEALFHRLAGSGFNVSSPPEFKQPIADDDEVVTVRSHFQPLVQETMTKDMTEKIIGGGLDSLAGLQGWTKQNIEWTNLGVAHFKSFFPKKEADVTNVGNVYFIYKDQASSYGTNFVSSNRYYPPQLEESLVVIHRLLSMFHPRPFLRNRFPVQGATACVRAYNDEYIDIVFRIHSEFQLNEPPFYPFWFTPGQFTGNLVVTRDQKKIIHFHMYVPTEKRLNVDMEWLNGPLEGENMEVDIGFMPQMEVTITAPSVPLTPDTQHMKDLEVPNDDTMANKVSNIKWTKEITVAEARRNLEVKMYPFKEVEYFNFTNSFERAIEDKKLVHSILLWGALDDQSC